jgi:hypothetical protein
MAAAMSLTLFLGDVPAAEFQPQECRERGVSDRLLSHLQRPVVMAVSTQQADELQPQPRILRDADLPLALLDGGVRADVLFEDEDEGVGGRRVTAGEVTKLGQTAIPVTRAR